MVDVDTIVSGVTTHVATHPRRIVASFLVVTLLMTAGLGSISTETGTSQFSEGTPAEEALNAIDEDFFRPFAADTDSTQVIQENRNVLSKPAMLRMLRAQKRVTDRPELRVVETQSAASIVAKTIDPAATTPAAQIRTIEGATPNEVDAAVRTAAEGSGFIGTLSNDFNEQSASATATIAVLTHEFPGGTASGAGTSGASPVQSIQVETRQVIEASGGDFSVFGTGIISSEFESVIFDSLIIVIPAAVLLIVFFLVFAYRDPVDLFLGLLALVMTIVWTMGFMGLANVPFTQMLTAVPPLLLAVGIDFGIHSINRYREERVDGRAIVPSMEETIDQLLVAFFIVTGTTVIGFSANATSSLGPIRDFGLVAALGIVFTFLIFGIFLPAAKLLTDQYRDRHDLPQWGQRPIGGEDSVLGRSFGIGVVVAKRAPVVFLVTILLLAVVASGYGAGVSTNFEQDDFLPPEDTPAYLDRLPEPFAPEEYTVTATLNYLEDNFATNAQSSVTIYVKGQLQTDHALQSIHRAGVDAPDPLVETDRVAQSTSVVGVIQEYREQDPAFDALVARNDANGDGIPDDNLAVIYDQLFASPYGPAASSYLTDDYRSARVVYDVESDASQEEAAGAARDLATRYRLPAVGTGQTVVFQEVADSILASAVSSLATALAGAAVFLIVIYRLLEDSGSLGIVNLVPIVVTLTMVLGTMRAIGMPFNALTATVLSIALGLGTDYSAHMTHRFVDEYDGTNREAALEATVMGTGGALTGSMLTTASGIGVLVLSITPVLGQFGTIMAISVIYSYLTAMLVTPSAVIVWVRLGGFSLP